MHAWWAIVEAVWGLLCNMISSIFVLVIGTTILMNVLCVIDFLLKIWILFIKCNQRHSAWWIGKFSQLTVDCHASLARAPNLSRRLSLSFLVVSPRTVSPLFSTFASIYTKLMCRALRKWRTRSRHMCSRCYHRNTYTRIRAHTISTFTHIHSHHPFVRTSVPLRCQGQLFLNWKLRCTSWLWWLLLFHRPTGKLCT